jgi:hypothetical protein
MSLSERAVVSRTGQRALFLADCRRLQQDGQALDSPAWFSHHRSFLPR